MQKLFPKNAREIRHFSGKGFPSVKHFPFGKCYLDGKCFPVGKHFPFRIHFPVGKELPEDNNMEKLFPEVSKQGNSSRRQSSGIL
jgi:hypothetical protein